jgi:hypothetical protein
MAVRGSRWEKSVYTYGLLGRVLWTLAGLGVLYLLLSPLIRILRGGLVNAGIGAVVPLFFGVAGAILLVWVWPRFFRDVWQPASAAGHELTELRDRTSREAVVRERTTAHSDAQPLSQRTGPTRW